MLKYVWYRKGLDLRLQLEQIKSAALEAFSEKDSDPASPVTDNEINDEIEQGLVNIVDKSNTMLKFLFNTVSKFYYFYAWIT